METNKDKYTHKLLKREFQFWLFFAAFGKVQIYITFGSLTC